MDTLIKKEIETEALDSSSINLEPEVKWIKEEHDALDEEQSYIKLTSEIFVCEYCPYKTLQKESFDVHLKTHSSDLLDELDEAEVPVKHEEIMLDDEEFDLEIKFQCDSEIKNNNSMHESVEEIPVNKMEADMLLPKIKEKEHLSDKIFICKLCNYKTLQKQRYEEHRKTHISSKSFKCRECNFITPSSQSLHCHMLSHTYRCNLCSYKASSRHYLKVHMNAHHSSYSQILKCAHCPFTSLYKNALNSHQNNHIGKEYKIIKIRVKNVTTVFNNPQELIEEKIDMPFQCDECSYKTLRKDYLDRHKVFHHKDKLLQCNECGQKFALQRSLLLHLKNHVKQEN